MIGVQWMVVTTKVITLTSRETCLKNHCHHFISSSGPLLPITLMLLSWFLQLQLQQECVCSPCWISNSYTHTSFVHINTHTHHHHYHHVFADILLPLRMPDVLLSIKTCPPFPLKPTSPGIPISFDEYSLPKFQIQTHIHIHTCHRRHFDFGEDGPEFKSDNRKQSLSLSEAQTPHLYNGDTYNAFLARWW